MAGRLASRASLRGALVSRNHCLRNAVNVHGHLRRGHRRSQMPGQTKGLHQAASPRFSAIDSNRSGLLSVRLARPSAPSSRASSGGGARADEASYLKDIIDRLNRIFGEATPIEDRAAFVNQITDITRNDNVVMAQVENNTREQALKDSLSSAVQHGVTRALSSHQELATQSLKSDSQGMSALTNLVYDLLA